MRSRRVRAGPPEICAIELGTLITTFVGKTSDTSIPTVVGLLVILILSLAFHEVAHAWVAWKRGDSTAKDLGRITLDPIPHIDLWWTIIVPTFLWLSVGLMFGGAKPVPVNYHNLRSPRRDMALVAIAGPAMNILIAIVLALILKIFSQSLGIWSPGEVGYQILYHGARLNILLAVFNLMPLPPLDGSRVLMWLLPENLRAPYQRLESFGILIVLGLLYMTNGVVFRYLFETVNIVAGWVEAIVTLGGLW